MKIIKSFISDVSDCAENPQYLYEVEFCTGEKNVDLSFWFECEKEGFQPELLHYRKQKDLDTLVQGSYDTEDAERFFTISPEFSEDAKEELMAYFNADAQRLFQELYQ